MTKLNQAILMVLALVFIFTAIATNSVAQSVKPSETVTKQEQPTLRDKLSQPTPMVSSFEVKAKHHGVYYLANVNGDELDQADYALEGDYEVGDVVTVLWADDSGEEIAGDVLVGKASELDVQWNKGGTANER